MLTFEQWSNQTPEPDGSITVINVGDIYPGRNIDHKAVGIGYGFPYVNIGDAIDCDLLVGNLEGVVLNEIGRTYRGISKPKLSITTSALDALADVGFGAFTIANNHMSDFGSDAIKNTIKECYDRNILVMGEEGDVIVRNINGVKVAFIGMVDDKHFTINPSIQGTETFDFTLLKEAKDLGYIVIVNVHMGTEYEKQANQRQIDIAHRLVDNGADIVLFHHSHVIQNTEWYKGKFIAYSLGNWIFDQDQEGTQEGLSVRMTIDKNGIQKVEQAKHTIDNYIINYKEWEPA